MGSSFPPDGLAHRNSIGLLSGMDRMEPLLPGPRWSSPASQLSGQARWCWVASQWLRIPRVNWPRRTRFANNREKMTVLCRETGCSGTWSCLIHQLRHPLRTEDSMNLFYNCPEEKAPHSLSPSEKKRCECNSRQHPSPLPTGHPKKLRHYAW